MRSTTYDKNDKNPNLSAMAMLSAQHMPDFIKIESIIEEIEQSLAFEKQRDVGNNDIDGWTQEYHAGYITGLEQALSIIKNQTLCS